MRWRPVLVGILFALSRASAHAADRQIQIQPFIAVSLGARTTFPLLDTAVQKANVVFGARAVVLGEIVGFDVDVGHAPGFFQSADNIVLHSRLTTVSGNLVVAAPRRLTEYTLRPFFVGGGGIMRARAEDFFGALPVSDTLPAIDLGGGVSGFITDKVGVAWDLRYFRSVAGNDESGETNFGTRLSFWRASMALAFRY
jgi:hypothetical protein